MSTKEQYWKYSLIVIILFMGVIIFRQITPFLGGLLGALTIYILVRGQMNHLVEKRKLKRSISALLITAETIFVFLIPLGLTVWMVANKLQDINLDPQTYIAPIQQVAEFIKEKTGYDVLGKDTLSFIMSILPRIGQIIMESISSLAINLFVMIFVLYFMLIGGKKMEAYVNDILPFNETNTQEVIHEINMIVRSNAIGIPLLAIIQGGVAMIGYLLFGAPNILMLGFLTCFATIIPMVGTALVWFPVAAYLAISGDWFNAIGLFGYGAIVVSQSDNLIRFILQKKTLEAGPGPLGDLISVVDPAGERLQPGRFHRGVREHHDARQTADERGVERVDVHPRLRRRKFHLAHARKPLHSLLHVVFQPGATQHVAHDDGSRVKIAHAVPQVVQGSLRTSRGEALIQKMPRQQHIHPLQLRPLGGVRSGIVGHGDLEQEVVVFAQRLAVVVEQFADIGMAQINIGLGIAHEPDRLAPKRPVGIFRNAVCVEAFAQGLHRHRLPAFEQQFAQTPFDGRHIAPLPLTDRGGECGHRIAPRLQQREPVARGRGVDERRLEIGRMVPHVLKRGCLCFQSDK